MAVKNESWTTSSLEERETIISYDRLLDCWHIWTDEPKHARKYEKYIDEQQPTRKGYNPKSGQLVMLPQERPAGNVRGRFNKRECNYHEKEKVHGRPKNHNAK